MRSPQYQVDHIGRHMKSSKLRHAWTFFLEATELKVIEISGYGRLVCEKKTCKLLNCFVFFAQSGDVRNGDVFRVFCTSVDRCI